MARTIASINKVDVNNVDSTAWLQKCPRINLKFVIYQYLEVVRNVKYYKKTSILNPLKREPFENLKP